MGSPEPVEGRDRASPASHLISLWLCASWRLWLAGWLRPVLCDRFPSLPCCAASVVWVFPGPRLAPRWGSGWLLRSQLAVLRPRLLCWPLPLAVGPPRPRLAVLRLRLRGRLRLPRLEALAFQVRLAGLPAMVLHRSPVRLRPRCRRIRCAGPAGFAGHLGP